MCKRSKENGQTELSKFFSTETYNLFYFILRLTRSISSAKYTIQVYLKRNEKNQLDFS